MSSFNFPHMAFRLSLFTVKPTSLQMMFDNYTCTQFTAVFFKNRKTFTMFFFFLTNLFFLSSLEFPENSDIGVQLIQLNISIIQLQSTMDRLQANITKVQKQIDQTLSNPNCTNCSAFSSEVQNPKWDSSVTVSLFYQKKKQLCGNFVLCLPDCCTNGVTD